MSHGAIRGCSQILFWCRGVYGCLPPVQELLVWCQVEVKGWFSACSSPATVFKKLVPALQTGHFLRAALTGINCSPQPGDSWEWTFGGISLRVGTYSSFGSGTVQVSDRKNDDTEQAKGCKRASVDGIQDLHHLLWNKPGTGSSHCNTQPLCFSAFL